MAYIHPKTAEMLYLTADKAQIVADRGIPLRNWFLGRNEMLGQAGSLAPHLANLAMHNPASRLMAEAELRLPPGLPDGSPVEITFDLNEQGRLHAHARDLTHGQEIEVEIEGADAPEIAADEPVIVPGAAEQVAVIDLREEPVLQDLNFPHGAVTGVDTD